MGFEILNILNYDFITYTSPGTHLSDEPNNCCEAYRNDTESCYCRNLTTIAIAGLSATVGVITAATVHFYNPNRAPMWVFSAIGCLTGLVSRCVCLTVSYCAERTTVAAMRAHEGTALVMNRPLVNYMENAEARNVEDLV